MLDITPIRLLLRSILHIRLVLLLQGSELLVKVGLVHVHVVVSVQQLIHVFSLVFHVLHLITDVVHRIQIQFFEHFLLLAHSMLHGSCLTLFCSLPSRGCFERSPW